MPPPPAVLARWLLPVAAVAALAAAPTTAHAVEQGFIDVSVEGNGRVTGTQIDCPGDSCRGRYFWPNDTAAPPQRLVAAAGPGFAFEGWSGCFAVVNRPLECDAMPHSEGAAVLARFVDVTDPTVTGWTLPADLTVVRPSSRIGVQADAGDNDAVARVEYRINGNLRGEATSAPWGTTISVPTPLEDGMQQLTAQAFDRSGRRSDIRTRTIISDHTPPTIEIDGPETVRTQATYHDVRFTAVDPHLTVVTCSLTAPSGTTTNLGACRDARAIPLSTVGSWTFAVTAYDSVGNRADAELTVIREAVPDPGPGPGPDPKPGPGPAPGPDPGLGTGLGPVPGPLPAPAPFPTPPGAPSGNGLGTPKAPSNDVKRCVVPRVARGTALKTAKSRLSRANCRVRTVRATSRSVRAGRVIRISSKAGKQLPKGTRITVTVARR